MVCKNATGDQLASDEITVEYNLDQKPKPIRFIKHFRLLQR